MKFIAKEPLECEFGVLAIGDSFEAEPSDERAAQLMVEGKVVADVEEEKPEEIEEAKEPKKVDEKPEEKQEEPQDNQEETEPELPDYDEVGEIKDEENKE